MRIGHVIPTYVPAFRYGGPIRSVHGLAEAQAAAGEVVEVFTTDADGERRVDVPLSRPIAVGRHHVRYFAAAAPRRLARAPGMRRAIQDRLPDLDVLHLHSVFQLPTATAARAARQSRRPYVISPRGMLDAELIARRGALRKRLWIVLVERRNLAGAAVVVATSDVEAAAIRRLGLDLAPIAVVPNGVDLAELEAPEPAAVSAPIRRAIAAGPCVLYLGRLSWKKRIDLLIDALPSIAGARLIIAGSDDERLGPRLSERARAGGVADRVSFVGEVGGADRVALLRAAGVLALPSVGENFGNAVLEAMACRVPVVVSPEVGLAAEVLRSECGRVVDAEPAAIAAAIGSLLGDPQRARAAGARGREAVEARYTWSAVAERMRDVYCKAGAG